MQLELGFATPQRGDDSDEALSTLVCHHHPSRERERGRSARRPRDRRSVHRLRLRHPRRDRSVGARRSRRSGLIRDPSGSPAAPTPEAPGRRGTVSLATPGARFLAVEPVVSVVFEVNVIDVTHADKKNSRHRCPGHASSC
jgi:hypothetical protein